ncbi:MAG: RNA polymerase sigma factor [Blastocatellia bacterium]
MDEQRAIELFLTQRDEEAFCALFVAVYGRMRRYFLLRGVDRMTAEDLAQQVMLAVYQKAGEFADHRLFQGWLFAIARNELLQHWRRGQARPQTIELEPMRAAIEEQFAVAPEIALQTELDDWLTLLEPNERELVLLRFVEGLSYEELALVLGIPLGTVKSRLFSVKEKLLALTGAGSAKQSKQKIH